MRKRNQALIILPGGNYQKRISISLSSFLQVYKCMQSIYSKLKCISTSLTFFFILLLAFLLEASPRVGVEGQKMKRFQEFGVWSEIFHSHVLYSSYLLVEHLHSCMPFTKFPTGSLQFLLIYRNSVYLDNIPVPIMFLSTLHVASVCQSSSQS